MKRPLVRGSAASLVRTPNRETAPASAAMSARGAERNVWTIIRGNYAASGSTRKEQRSDLHSLRRGQSGRKARCHRGCAVGVRKS